MTQTAIAKPATLRLRRPRPESPAPTIPRGVRPGVRAIACFGEAYFTFCLCGGKYSAVSSIVPDMGACNDCGHAWHLRAPSRAREACGTCMRVAQRTHATPPEPVDIGMLHLCCYCGETLCQKHVAWEGEGYYEDAGEICRSCARERKVPTNRQTERDSPY